MKDFPFHFFIVAAPAMACILFLFYKAVSYYFKRKQDKLLEIFGNNYIYKIEGVRCKTFRSGGAWSSPLFNRCTLYLLDNGILIMGYNKFFGLTFYSESIIFTKNVAVYDNLYWYALIERPKKVNPDSFGNTVYIDIGESGSQNVTINIILKGLTTEEKQFFRNF